MKLNLIAKTKQKIVESSTNPINTNAFANEEKKLVNYLVCQTEIP